MRSRFAFVVVCLLAACGPDAPPAAPPASDLARLELAADPGPAMSVLEAREAGAGERVSVVGRIDAIVEGLAAFTVVDESLPYCGEVNTEDDCPTPWDYCCESRATKNAHTVVVEARGADGRPLAADTLPGLRLLDEVVVQGELRKDEHGNVTVLADGWFRRARPRLRDDLHWPR